MLGAGGGGLSGPPVKHIALRAVHDVARAHPGVPIVGTGGVVSGRDAADLPVEQRERLAAMDEVHRIAQEAKVPLVPLARTEGIIREINVPRALAEVADVKRRGPVVIFRRGSTIVTTTEEAATYLELWLKERFNELHGMTKEELEMFIQLPVTTAHVVVVLQHRARIEAEIERAQGKIEELQAQAESHLYDLYEMTDAEREFLRAAVA